MASSSSSVDHEGCVDRKRCFYHHWMYFQQFELFQLKGAITLCSKGEDGTNMLINKVLIDSILNNFAEFLKQRAEFAQGDASSVLAPPWCNSSLLWFGGCKPSAYIKLIHTLKYESMRQSTPGATKLVDLTVAQGQKMDKLLKETVTVETMFSDELTEAVEGGKGQVWKLIEGADWLRLKTLKSIHGILTPPQMLKFLAVAKKSDQLCFMK